MTLVGGTRKERLAFGQELSVAVLASIVHAGDRKQIDLNNNWQVQPLSQIDQTVS